MEPLSLTWSLENTCFEAMDSKDLARFLEEIAFRIGEGETDGESTDMFDRIVVKWSIW